MHRTAKVVKKGKKEGDEGSHKQTNLFDSFRFQKGSSSSLGSSDSKATDGTGASSSSPGNRKRGTGQLPHQTSVVHEPPAYVPEALHKNVIYDRVGTRALSIPQQAVYEFVLDHFLIPLDLEISHKYGPLSGRSYEERVIAAYLHGLLELRPEYSHLSPDADELKACTTCGEVGHVANYCPGGF